MAKQKGSKSKKRSRSRSQRRRDAADKADAARAAEESSRSILKQQKKDDDNGNDDDDDATLTHTNKKQRFRSDDDDDVTNDADKNGDDEAIPSEAQLLEAKRKRREQGHGGSAVAAVASGTTHINDITSLDTEGVKIEPFHMNDEKNDGEGFFDGDTYVFRKKSARDMGEEPDAWLEDLGSGQKDEAKDGKRSTAAATSSFVLSQSKAAAAAKRKSDQDSMDNLTTQELHKKIIPLVSDTETISKALSRYGNLIKAYHKSIKRSNMASKPGSPNKRELANQKKAAAKAKDALDELTSAANALLFKGDVDVYQRTRAQIMAKLNAPSNPVAATHKLPTEKQPPCKWQYRGNDDNQLHGPYTTEQMISWTQAGYFVGAQSVQIRTVRLQPKSTEEDLMADLMDDDDDDDDDGDMELGHWVSSGNVNFQAYIP